MTCISPFLLLKKKTKNKQTTFVLRGHQKNAEAEVPFTISTTHQKQTLELFCMINLQSCFTLCARQKKIFYLRIHTSCAVSVFLIYSFSFTGDPQCFTWLICWTQLQNSLYPMGRRGGACLLCFAAVSRRRFTSSGVMESFGGFERRGKRDTLAPRRRLMLGLTGLCVIGHVPQQSGWWLGGAAVRRPHHQASSTYTSVEGGGPEVDCRQADAVGGSVRHHATVIAAACAARHASFLLEVLSQAPARPGLLYLSLHL